MKKRQITLSVALVLLLVIIDQWIKIYVKTHFALHETYEVASWFKLVFVENNGMAFGMELGAKILLTLFRLVACGGIIWYMVRLIKRAAPTGYLLTIGVILAGALGNIVDCMFYGLVFDNPAQGVAQFVPFGEGYGPFLEGRVVDMFYFPLFEFNWPEWLPFVGGDHFIFFSPVFNFADACISCGVVAFILFYHKQLTRKGEKEPVDAHE
ncbi:MAG: lipoprotein signal peptidase [Bacteroidales bacterium]|nr:lipoprotein signal peptidase [Candidatus Physcousia equi]